MLGFLDVLVILVVFLFARCTKNIYNHRVNCCLNEVFFFMPAIRTQRHREEISKNIGEIMIAPILCYAAGEKRKERKKRERGSGIKRKKKSSSSPAPHPSGHYYGCTGPLRLFVLLLVSMQLYRCVCSVSSSAITPASIFQEMLKKKTHTHTQSPNVQ